MTKFDNKFVPSTPKTYTVSELRDTQQPVKKSSLSVAARSKVVNRSGVKVKVMDLVLFVISHHIHNGKIYIYLVQE